MASSGVWALSGLLRAHPATTLLQMSRSRTAKDGVREARASCARGRPLKRSEPEFCGQRTSVLRLVTVLPDPSSTATTLPPPWPAGSKLTNASSLDPRDRQPVISQVREATVQIHVRRAQQSTSKLRKSDPGANPDIMARAPEPRTTVSALEPGRNWITSTPPWSFTVAFARVRVIVLAPVAPEMYVVVALIPAVTEASFNEVPSTPLSAPLAAAVNEAPTTAPTPHRARPNSS